MIKNNPKLSKREQEVKALLALGLKDCEVADRLGIDVRSISGYKQNIKVKEYLQKQNEKRA